jgi:hypothetical protein
MTKYVLITSLIGVTALLAVQEKSVVKHKPEYPKVILNSPDSSQRIVTECPRNLPKSYESVFAEDGQTPEMAKHCQKCSIGVYSLHENEEFAKCTWCGEKEK